MRSHRSCLAALAAVVLLGACATPMSERLPPGSPVAAVTAQFGPPSAEHLLPGGARRLEYTGGTYGKQTWMFDIDAGGRLVAAQQVRAEARFNTIRAGMSAAEVRATIGPPSTTWPIPRQNQIVWSYRYESPFCQWFMVGVNPQGEVIDTSYGPDPLCDDDDLFMRMRPRLR